MSGTISLSKAERVELSQRASSQAGRADDARRARLILLLEAGETWAQICEKLSCNDAFIDRWSKRFADERLAGLFSRHAGQQPRTLSPELEARILEWTVKRKPPASTHWSTRKLAEQLGVSHMMIARVWRKHSLKPQRLDGYMSSDDPDFERKAADIIALYVHPPQHAAVFCVDEKTAIQALDRLDPVLPLSPGRAERHGFEYYRHGTLSLYAAFNTKTGEVLGKTAARHTSAEFVAFLTDIVVNQPRGKEIHVIADNLSAHKTAQVKDFLQAHRNVHMHFTPTYLSWLNQVELWFSKIEREVIARGVFTSVPDLKRKLMRYIRHYNKSPKRVKWKYFDPTRRITPTSAVTVH
ncbi:MAG: IS630 family transposase [Steroidobacteraceae bacterium]